MPPPLQWLSSKFRSKANLELMRKQLMELLSSFQELLLEETLTCCTCTTSQCLLKKELLKRASGGSLAAIAATKHWNLLNKAIRMAVMKTEVRVI